jgi:hypothetical protein
MAKNFPKVIKKIQPTNPESSETPTQDKYR